MDDGTYANVPAPPIAIDYWELAPDARLREVIVAVRADEAHHRDVNHRFADDWLRDPEWACGADSRRYSVVLPSKCSRSASASARVWWTTPSR